jgi:hypothetical protein
MHHKLLGRCEALHYVNQAGEAQPEADRRAPPAPAGRRAGARAARRARARARRRRRDASCTDHRTL